MSKHPPPSEAVPQPIVYAPVVVELSDALDPFEACRRLTSLPHLLFLDSAAGDGFLGRYSFLTADPLYWLIARGDPLDRLERLLKQHQLETLPDLPPFQGGFAGLWSYDLCHRIERLPHPRYDEFHVPELAVGLYDWVIGFDHLRHRAWLISRTGQLLPERGRGWRERRVRDVLDLLAAPAPSQPAPVDGKDVIVPRCHHPLPGHEGVWSNFTRTGYLEAAQRAIDYTHAGDCFQVNLSQRLLAPSIEPPLDLYGRLRQKNPAPFAGYFDLGEFIVASASPERFLRMNDGAIETRPIKGTRPRGATPEEDEEQRRQLLASAKDRAENVMIVDLLRNDLGRVSSYGSVRVESLCRLESYRHVHHLVSEVRGQLRPGLGPMDLLRATFPGGSVTGAPKVRAMEIIAELEPTSRGPYCGCLGYIGFDGSMDLNLLIRTFTIGRGWVQFPVGGGIVADSTPESEYAETLAKAEGLLRSLR